MNRAEFAARLGAEPSTDSAAVMLSARDPQIWRQQFAAAAAGQGPVFVANPDWGSREKADFDVLCRQDAEGWDPEQGWLMIPTGGSSGRIKLARHDQGTLLAAVNGYAEFLGEPKLSAMGVLPLHHVGGLMGWLRAALTGGEYLDVDWRRVANGDFPSVDEGRVSISLVPTQLSRLLDLPAGIDWLRRFAQVLIGGAALDDGLAQRARLAGVRLMPSYGATETAAMAAAQRVEGFLAGNEPGLAVLPHISAKVDTRGQLCLSGPSVFGGYWPESGIDGRIWDSGDAAIIGEGSRIVVTGRLDRLINSGGEKVDPAEVESVLRSLVGDDRIAVVGVPDPDWGQRVVAVHANGVDIDLSRLKTEGALRLAAFKWPKSEVMCDPWPLNALGKLDHAQLRVAAVRAVSN